MIIRILFFCYALVSGSYFRTRKIVSSLVVARRAFAIVYSPLDSFDPSVNTEGRKCNVRSGTTRMKIQSNVWVVIRITYSEIPATIALYREAASVLLRFLSLPVRRYRGQ